MRVICSPTGHVEWRYTRELVVKSGVFSLLKKRDFGAGDEYAAKCPGCQRVLPTVCMHLDHIKPQAKYTPTMSVKKALILFSKSGMNGVSRSKEFIGEVNGGIARIYKLDTRHRKYLSKRLQKIAERENKTQGDPKLLNTSTVWKNDLDNLQFLCMGCNTSKSDNLAFFAAAPLGSNLNFY